MKSKPIPKEIPFIAGTEKAKWEILLSKLSKKGLPKPIGRLRIKESDRLNATVQELSKLGFDLMEKEDSILINSRKNFIHNNKEVVSLSSHSDHRIAMTVAIASTCYEGEIILDNLDCVKKSYPNFWEVFLLLGGKIYEYLG